MGVHLKFCWPSQNILTLACQGFASILITLFYKINQSSFYFKIKLENCKIVWSKSIYFFSLESFLWGISVFFDFYFVFLYLSTKIRDKTSHSIRGSTQDISNIIHWNRYFLKKYYGSLEENSFIGWGHNLLVSKSFEEKNQSIRNLWKVCLCI